MRRRLLAIGALLVAGSLAALAFWPDPAAALAVHGRFADDDGNPHEPNIEAIAEAEITFGCGGGNYCPHQITTRAQMASFLVRAFDLPPSGSAGFTDLGNTVHAADIDALAAAGITRGCAPDRYCPEAPVRRDEMASFLARALRLSPATPSFTDVSPESTHYQDIGAIAARGITLGCATNLYCPADPVLRDQMASFLARSLDLDPVYPRLPLSDGVPLTCSKDGLVCNAVVDLAYRPHFGIREGFYNVLPYRRSEESELAAGGTRVELTVNGSPVPLVAEPVSTGGERAYRWFEATITLAPGRHVLVARWYWNGELTQTTTLTANVSG